MLGFDAVSFYEMPKIIKSRQLSTVLSREVGGASCFLDIVGTKFMITLLVFQI
jgi:hypothetical protein